MNEVNETDEELPYKTKRLITELVNEHIEYRGSRIGQNIILKIWNRVKETKQFSIEEENIEENSESSIESYKLMEDVEKEMQEELIGMGYELDMSEIERLIRIHITKEIVLIEGFIDFYLYNRKLKDEELHHKYDNDSEYIGSEDSFEKLELEEKITKLLKRKREIMGIASEEEIRKFLEWGYIESIIMDNDIILEYRKLRMEGDPYDEDNGIVKERLDRYIIDKEIRAIKRKEENEEEIELNTEYELSDEEYDFNEQETEENDDNNIENNINTLENYPSPNYSDLEIINSEELNPEIESNSETSEDEINQKLENFRGIL
ncbi:hypothetical protein RCL_jg3731.t1 [Rhizophagus clarus]|uniref:Uncharacterized protein n=1 Tax=Rhizophagus clarus TaxID=94130 RepID=A0A8H3M558_9GLOM|nr:hypothetical protein RCL_jg3731.t1 [Rhizophagus clarus]